MDEGLMANGVSVEDMVYVEGQVVGSSTRADGTITIKFSCQELPQDVTGFLVAGLTQRHVGIILGPQGVVNRGKFELLLEAIRLASSDNSLD